MSDSDDFELEDSDIGPAVLEIRRTSVGWYVLYEGLPLPVDHVDMDERAVEALGRQLQHLRPPRLG